MEDVHYALVLQDTPGQYVNTFTVQYRWRRGGRLDQQLPKFRQPMDNSRELAAELERYHQTPSERWVLQHGRGVTPAAWARARACVDWVRAYLPPAPLIVELLFQNLGVRGWDCDGGGFCLGR